MRRFVMASGAMLLLAFAATSLMLLMLAACGGGRGAALPVPPVQQPQVEEGSEDGSENEQGSQSSMGSDMPTIPPPAQEPAWVDPVWGIPYFNIEEHYAVILFKPEGWWIDEDYPIDDNTPPWKIHQQAAIEELEARGFGFTDFFDVYPFGNPSYRGRSYIASLPERMTFLDAYEELPPDFPCIEHITAHAPADFSFVD